MAVKIAYHTNTNRIQRQTFSLVRRIPIPLSNQKIPLLTDPRNRHHSYVQAQPWATFQPAADTLLERFPSTLSRNEPAPSPAQLTASFSHGAGGDTHTHTPTPQQRGGHGKTRAGGETGSAKPRSSACPSAGRSCSNFPPRNCQTTVGSSLSPSAHLHFSSPSLGATLQVLHSSRETKNRFLTAAALNLRLNAAFY